MNSNRRESESTGYTEEEGLAGESRGLADIIIVCQSQKRRDWAE